MPVFGSSGVSGRSLSGNMRPQSVRARMVFTVSSKTKSLPWRICQPPPSALYRVIRYKTPSPFFPFKNKIFSYQFTVTVTKTLFYFYGLTSLRNKHTTTKPPISHNTKIILTIGLFVHYNTNRIISVQITPGKILIFKKNLNQDQVPHENQTFPASTFTRVSFCCSGCHVCRAGALCNLVPTEITRGVSFSYKRPKGTPPDQLKGLHFSG